MLVVSKNLTSLQISQYIQIGSKLRICHDRKVRIGFVLNSILKAQPSYQSAWMNLMNYYIRYQYIAKAT